MVKLFSKSKSSTKIGPKTKKFRESLIIKKVGARPIKTKKGSTVFKLGGGIFSRNQILASCKRLARLKNKT